MNPLYLDCEVYKNYFLAMFMTEEGRIGYVEKFNDSRLDLRKLEKLVTATDRELYTFNGDNYDIPIIRVALSGASNATIKAASDAIIVKQIKHWQLKDNGFYLADIKLNHVDLFEVAPGRSSLKLYGGRMHSQKLQDLPVEPDAEIQEEQVGVLRKYCRNDLLVTQSMRKALVKQIDLRRTIRDEMLQELVDAKLGNLFTPDDLRSKSDAQIAESVLKQRVFIASGVVPRKSQTQYKSFFYKPPAYLKFRSESMQHVLDTIVQTKITVGETGHVQMPDDIDTLDVTIGTSTYKLGLGGLHSQESEVCHIAGPDTVLKDIDVASYYPSLMLNLGMYPDSMGPHFLKAYGAIREERLLAKHTGDKTKADVLKITLNGTYGKTSSKYSVLYNPKLTMYTTLTGQLAMLMLIEVLEKVGIPVISANTDGIVVHCAKDKEDLQRRVVKAWEAVTNLETEETYYKALYLRDVNSYIAIKPDGTLKSKGAFALPKTDAERLAKNPQNEICIDAVIAAVTTGVPTTTTIMGCRDIRKFVSVRKVTGGAVKNGEVVGKTVRWYYAKGIDGTMNYAKNGNIVPRSKGAKPCLDLPDVFPDDVDFDWYIKEAAELMRDIGAVKRPPKPKLPRRGTKVWKELELAGMVEVEDGVPCWAIPYSEIPNEYKIEGKK